MKVPPANASLYLLASPRSFFTEWIVADFTFTPSCSRIFELLSIIFELLSIAHVPWGVASTGETTTDSSFVDATGLLSVYLSRLAKN